MPTKTILIADLLEKRIDAPVDWSFGFASFWGWYHFVQTIRFEKDTVINKATLTMEVKSYCALFGWEFPDFNNPVRFAFNGFELKGPEQFREGSGWRLYTGQRTTIRLDVTDKLRVLSGDSPQLLSVGIAPTLPGYTANITLTAYLDIDYAGSEPTPVGAGGGKEATATEAIGQMVTFMMNMMLIMMLMSMIISITGMLGGS